MLKPYAIGGACKNPKGDDVQITNLKDKLQAYAAEQACKALAVLLKKNSRIFQTSIYAQIKQLILSPEISDGRIFSATMLKDMLTKDVKTKKKYGDMDDLCDRILNELQREKIIKHADGKVYRIGER